MNNCFDQECKKMLREMRNFMKDIDHKISHLIEMDRLKHDAIFYNKYGRGRNND